MVKLVDTEDLKSSSERNSGSSPDARTIHSRKPSAKQIEQQKLFIALGTVMGFNGYLTNLNHVVNRTSIYQYDKLRLNAAILNLREQLDSVKDSIRTELTDL